MIIELGPLQQYYFSWVLNNNFESCVKKIIKIRHRIGGILELRPPFVNIVLELKTLVLKRRRYAVKCNMIPLLIFFIDFLSKSRNKQIFFRGISLLVHFLFGAG